MTTTAFAERRGKLEAYFDRTAFDAWKQLTSDAPVSKIRATVRAGRDRMRTIMSGWLPADLTGASVLDAGCGTGSFSFELAQRGARMIAIDLSGNLVDIAREREPTDLAGGLIDFRVGDMLNSGCGMVDHVVAMDSLIHYETRDVVAALVRLASHTNRSIVFTLTPRTPLLTVMLAIGSLFPRGDRAPAIVPAGMKSLARQIVKEPDLAGWSIGRTERVMSGFYTSQAIELVRK